MPTSEVQRFSIFFIRRNNYYLTTLPRYDSSQIFVLQVLAEKYKPPSIPPCVLVRVHKQIINLIVMIHQIDIFLICQLVSLLLQVETKLLLLIDHATTDKDNTTQDINGRHVLFYIRKDYNLMWSVVTDIGEKRKQAGRVAAKQVSVFKNSSTCCRHYQLH